MFKTESYNLHWKKNTLQIYGKIVVSILVIQIEITNKDKLSINTFAIYG